MSPWLPVIVGWIGSVVLGGGGAFIGTQIALARVEERQKAMAERANERFERLEHMTGVSTGDAIFMRTASCPLLDVNFRQDFHEMKKRLEDLEREFHAFAANHHETG